MCTLHFEKLSISWTIPAGGDLFFFVVFHTNYNCIVDSPATRWRSNLQEADSTYVFTEIDLDHQYITLIPANYWLVKTYSHLVTRETSLLGSATNWHQFPTWMNRRVCGNLRWGKLLPRPQWCGDGNWGLSGLRQDNPAQAAEWLIGTIWVEPHLIWINWI